MYFVYLALLHPGAGGAYTGANLTRARAGLTYTSRVGFETRVGLTHSLNLDRAFITSLAAHESHEPPLFVPLAGPLPFAYAHHVREYLARRSQGWGAPGGGVALTAKDRGIASRRVRGFLREARRDAGRALRYLGYDPRRYLLDVMEGGYTQGYGRPAALPSEGYLAIPSEECLEHLASQLGGRILFADEAGGIVGPGGWPPGLSVADALHYLCLFGMARVTPSVEIVHPGTARCNRCGEEENLGVVVCPYCGGRHCLVCRECNSMGESRMCRPLFIVPRRPRRCPTDRQDGGAGEAPRREEGPYGDPRRHDRGHFWDGIVSGPWDFRLDFQLTAPQEAAALALRRFISGDPRRECLLWAACGAGKTEVSFGAMAEILGRGGRVLYAVPRRDVVAELAPRIMEAFCHASIAQLHGAGRYGPPDADISVTTTHQAIRFYHNFDLVVLDEADAYPYQGSRMLHHAVLRAAGESAKIIYMTATPRGELKRRALAGQLALVTIPARHHGYPVPVPEIVKVQLGVTSGQGTALALPRMVIDLIASRISKATPAASRAASQAPGPLYVFTPTINLARDVARKLDLSWTYAGDSERSEKIRRFKAGEIPALVTTTILERGITVPGADVLVLYADYERVFDEGTLIQMAGRAGRTSERPEGKVWFVAGSVSASMKQAVRTIQWLNREAHRLGYLRPGVYESGAPGSRHP
ncbi:MAG TPA: DEAD/DEAH box helicase family protein [Firmicutes bacterium]|nr:DEAD/DEAH box helicase family protein [Bacillota bacterium]